MKKNQFFHQKLIQYLIKMTPRDEIILFIRGMFIYCAVGIVVVGLFLRYDESEFNPAIEFCEWLNDASRDHTQDVLAVIFIYILFVLIWPVFSGVMLIIYVGKFIVWIVGDFLVAIAMSQCGGTPPSGVPPAMAALKDEM